MGSHVTIEDNKVALPFWGVFNYIGLTYMYLSCALLILGRPSLNWIQQIINDVREIKLIETQKSDSAKPIFSKLENAAKDSVAFRKKVDCCIPCKGCLRKENQK